MKYALNLSIGLPLAMLTDNVPQGMVLNAVVTILTTWIVEYYRSRKNAKKN